jgi:spore coat polysaccharide biosynthesis protein SpsF
LQIGKTIITIEARMNSSRLPGKVMLKANGQPLLEHMITRLKQLQTVDLIVIATTQDASDDLIQALAERLGVGFYRGSEDDVLGRVVAAGERFNASVIVSLTGDCPLIDTGIVDQTIRVFNNNSLAYVSNSHIRSYPDGMDVQVFSLDTLKKASALAKSKLEREHTTLSIRRNPILFPALHLVAPGHLHWPELGLTLDEEPDYVFICEILRRLKDIGKSKDYRLEDILEILKTCPELLTINQSVSRKGDT